MAYGPVSMTRCPQPWARRPSAWGVTGAGAVVAWQQDRTGLGCWIQYSLQGLNFAEQGRSIARLGISAIRNQYCENGDCEGLETTKCFYRRNWTSCSVSGQCRMTALPSPAGR